MEPFISLPYSEYESINQIQKYFKKADYSVCVPVSRQQKGLDFIILHTKSGKVLRFQVKGSRPFVNSTPDVEKGDYKYTFLFSNFHDRFSPGAADVYLLFGMYPVYDMSKNIKHKTQFWKTIVLAFTDDEMERFLGSIYTKNGKSRDRFFYISFNDPKGIIVSRGRADKPDITSHLLAHRASSLLERAS